MGQDASQSVKMTAEEAPRSHDMDDWIVHTEHSMGESLVFVHAREPKEASGKRSASSRPCDPMVPRKVPEDRGRSVRFETCTPPRTLGEQYKAMHMSSPSGDHGPIYLVPRATLRFVQSRAGVDALAPKNDLCTHVDYESNATMLLVEVL